MKLMKLKKLSIHILVLVFFCFTIISFSTQHSHQNFLECDFCFQHSSFNFTKITKIEILIKKNYFYLNLNSIKYKTKNLNLIFRNKSPPKI